MANDYYYAKFLVGWFDMTTGSPSFRHVYVQDIHAYVCKLLFTIGGGGGYYNVLVVVKEKQTIYKVQYICVIIDRK